MLNRRNFIKGSAASLAVAPLVATGAAASKPFNILWIMTDQQPVHMVGAYAAKGPQTPHLDRLAKEGVRFNRMHIAAFPCSPSRACMLTGRYAHNHGVTTNDVPLSEAVPTLGSITKAAGYTTGYVGKWHLSGSMYRNIKGAKPYDGAWYYEREEDPEVYRYTKKAGGTGEDQATHGFDYWRGGWKDYHAYLKAQGSDARQLTPRLGNHNDAPSGPEGTHIFSQLSEEDHTAAFFAKEASTFIRQQKDAENPFSLVLSFFGPHLPVAPPKPWDERYSLEEVPLPANWQDPMTDKPNAQVGNQRCYKGHSWSEEQFRDYIRRYWGYCSYIDAQIGRVFQALDETGQMDDTLVIFTSDHGDMVGAHGFIFKLGHCGYDELLRVPFLMRCPKRLPQATTNDALLSNIDILPTALEVLGVSSPEGVDGKSYYGKLNQEGQGHRETLFCNSGEHNYTVITARWKYVLNWNPRDLDELYDLQQDPEELHNLAKNADQEERIADLRSQLFAWLKETRHPYAQTVMKAADQDPPKSLDLRPEITDFKYLGDNRFQYAYRWHVQDQLSTTLPYWSFSHFCNPKYATDGDIAFRDTTWPEPGTVTWKKGGVYDVGPITITLPEKAGPGRYDVLIGLYNPQQKQGPGVLRGQQNSRAKVGTLVVKKKSGRISDISFRK